MDSDRTEHNMASTTVLGKWNVSTAWRESSAVLASNTWYSETLVWTLKDGKRDAIIHQDSFGYSLKKHNEIVAKLFDGKPLENDDE